MKAYLQIDLDIVNIEGFMEYVERIPELIQKHGGRYLVQGVEPVAAQGEKEIPQRSVLLEFPSKQDAESFLKERATTDLHEIWERTTKSRILLLEGCME
ncbi:MAG: DUF1330 domain-containing protein [bacterium]|jgi:uncharacterized protein (DUF1330 family)|nr:DUF1330 domain-containing protein [Gammaproteobacteria bacterium]HIL83592.1 DUF1330 domain-containing protein [Pseudomonadales bacterium]